MSAYRIDHERGLVIGQKGKPIVAKNGNGYVHVCKHAGKHVGLAHRMIWEAVNGPIPEGMQINHKNGVKTDNRLCNLEMVTGSENIRHAYRNGLMSAAGERNGRAVLTDSSVREIRSSTASADDLAERYSVSPKTISDVRRRRKWRHIP